ncbi:MAG: M20 family metallopeptidase [Vulcanisaeta sp.]
MSEFVDYVVSLLMDLIRIRTVVPPGENYSEFVDRIDRELIELGLDIHLIEVPKSRVKENYPDLADYPRYIVFAQLCNSKGKRLHFNAHYDVVLGGDGWSITEPFKPVFINGRVYGRGASDDKGGITALILLAKRISALREFHGCAEFSFTPDEEIGGLTGTNYLLEVIPKPDYAIVTEPTGLSNIWLGSMGILQLDIIVRGMMAHASEPWFGTNAFEDGVSLAYLLINDLKRSIEGRVFMGERATLTLGGFVRGGFMRNLVPDYFQFSIDRRILPNEDMNAVLNEIVNYIDEFRRKNNIGSSIDVNIVNIIEPAMNHHNSVITRELATSIKDTLHVNPSLTISRVPVDTRYFQRQGVDAVTYGPGDYRSAHGPDEYIGVNDIIMASEVYLRLINKIFSG